MTLATARLRPNVPWQPTRSTKRPLSTSKSAIAERGSMAHTTMRLLRMRSEVVWAARAKAASTRPASPKRQSSSTLPGASS
jgi:hypothetical protein